MVELNELLRKFYAKVKSEKGQPLTPHTLPGNFMMGLLFIDDFKHFSVIFKYSSQSLDCVDPLNTGSVVESTVTR